MPYEDVVNQKCLFCDATVTGSQEFMLEGKNLPGRMGRAPKWVKEKPEYLWAWNGLDDKNFYLCPNHQTDKDWQKAWEYAKSASSKQK